MESFRSKNIAKIIDNPNFLATQIGGGGSAASAEIWTLEETTVATLYQELLRGARFRR